MNDPARLPLTSLAGVGPVRARHLGRLGLETVRDLLFLVPRRLDELAGRVDVQRATELVGQEVRVAGRLGPPRLFRQGRRRSILETRVTDASGFLRALFFNQPWHLERLRELVQSGETVELSGRVVVTRTGPILSAPRIESPGSGDGETPGLRPVYPLTEGIGQALLRSLCVAAAREHAASLVEPLPSAELETARLPGLAEAVGELHLPSDVDGFERARRRLALERLLELQAAVARARAERAAASARTLLPSAHAREELFAGLPVTPTAAQRRVVQECLEDLACERPMRRLLQGDVGSGKTLVAFLVCRAVAACGGQSALLVPTEILAEQHYLGLSSWPAARGLSSVLVTGSLPPAERRRAHAALAAGEASLAVGTHALLSDAVRFRSLDLVVIDEQHRFGVVQKRALLEKGRDVHALLMTATPIPRTLALTVYGDLDKSVLDELPPGRGPVETRVVPPDRRKEALQLVAERLRAGERAFWVCPRIGAADGAEPEDGAAEAERAHAALTRGSLGAHGVELVHGGLPAEERTRRLERFRLGEARLLVGTSIVEVGLDVPEATVMVIEGAERFGLAQLHQLRGRIRRGAAHGWCLLLCDDPDGDRLACLESTDDGFEIAEADLRLRGMGDLAGARQSGENVEGLSDPAVDLELIQLAARLVRTEPGLLRHYERRGVEAAAV